MADISVRRTHTMTEEDAKAKVHQVVADIEQEFPSLVDDIKWNADKTKADVKGKGFTGKFAVTGNEVSIDIDLAFFARPFRGKVESRVESRMDEYFGQA